MSKNHEYFMDKQTMLDIGLALWKLYANCCNTMIRK